MDFLAEAAEAARPRGKKARYVKGGPSAEALETPGGDGRSLLWWALMRAPRRELTTNLLDIGVPAASHDSKAVATLMLAARYFRRNRLSPHPWPHWAARGRRVLGHREGITRL